MSHGKGHSQRVHCRGDSRVEQDPVAPQFHGNCDIAGGAHTGVDHNRIVRVVAFKIFQNDPDAGRIEYPLPGPDRAPGRHHASRPHGLQASRGDWAIARVAKHLKAFFNKNFRSNHGCHGVGQQGAWVRQDFEFDPIGTRIAQAFQQFTAQTGGSERVLGGEASCGVGQDGMLLQVDKIQDVAA